MKTAAIICEYNPLHRGHIRQFAAIRAALGPEVPLSEPEIAAWMSGAIAEEMTPLLGKIMK